MGGCSLPMQVAPADFEGMKIVCRSWKKNFANLHDFTADQEHISIRLFQLLEDTRVYKFASRYQFLPYADRQQHKGMESACDGVMDIIKNTDKKKIGGEGATYHIAGKILRQKEQPWIVVKSMPYGGYVLKEGDILRIGKQKVKVKELMEKSEEEKEDFQITAKGLIYEDLTSTGKALDLAEEETTQMTCRFCFDNAEVGNPLIAPCKCMGSSKYVHLGCLQKWLINTINPRDHGKAKVITWKPLHCQLCNQTLPFKVYLDGKSHFIVKMADLKPPRPYVILNPLYRSKDLGKGKIYMMISFAEQKEMKLGRQSDTDIHISSDSTVGRQNCRIVYEKGKGSKGGRFVLYDNESKFGTLVLLRRAFHMVNEINGVSVQFGKDVLQFKVGNKGRSNGEVNIEDPVNLEVEDEDEEEGQQQKVEGNQLPQQKQNERQQEVQAQA